MSTGTRCPVRKELSKVLRILDQRAWPNSTGRWQVRLMQIGSASWRRGCKLQCSTYQQVRRDAGAGLMMDCAAYLHYPSASSFIFKTYGFQMLQFVILIGNFGKHRCFFAESWKRSSTEFMSIWLSLAITKFKASKLSAFGEMTSSWRAFTCSKFESEPTVSGSSIQSQTSTQNNTQNPC